MSSNYPGVKFVSAVWRLEEKFENWSSFAYVLHTTAKTGHFASWIGQERLRNVQRRKMHVQSHCIFIVKQANFLRSPRPRRRDCLCSLKLPIVSVDSETLKSF